MASAPLSLNSSRRLRGEDYVDESLDDRDAEYSSMMEPDVGEEHIDGSRSKARTTSRDKGPGRGRGRTQRRGAEDDALERGEESDDRRSSSNDSANSFQLYTPDEERAVVRKFDRRLVLFLSLCYLLSFLDRSSEFSTLFCVLTHSLGNFLPCTESNVTIPFPQSFNKVPGRELSTACSTCRCRRCRESTLIAGF